MYSSNPLSNKLPGEYNYIPYATSNGNCDSTNIIVNISNSEIINTFFINHQKSPSKGIPYEI